MESLFVDQSIEIAAHPHTVWDVLTNPEYTRQWISNFGGIDGEIDSEWKLGSPVLWKNADGTVRVQGNVTALEPDKLLRFTVFDVNSEQPSVNDEDGITYQLSLKGDHTILHVRQGDFSAMPDGEKYRDMSAEIWARVLAQVKTLAEAYLTCGKGLAHNAGFAEKVGSMMAAMAEVLEVHMTALNLDDVYAREEYEAYARISGELRGVAAQLVATGKAMAGFWNLPMGEHDMQAMLHPSVRESFAQFVKAKGEVLDLLQTEAREDQEMLDQMA